VKPTRASLAAARVSFSASSTKETHTRVVGLAKGPKEARRRRGADQPSVLLLPEVRPCRPRALVCAKHVDFVDEVPVRLLHVLETDIAQDARIVDEHIDATKGIDGRLDDGFTVLDRVVVGNCLTACGADHFDNFVGGLSRRQQSRSCEVSRM